MSEMAQKEYWITDDIVFIPGREAQELAEAYGINDPERQERAIQGVVRALRRYVTDRGLRGCRSARISDAEIEEFVSSQS